MTKISRSDAAKQIGVPADSVTDWINAGIFGEVERMRNTHLLEESDVDRIAQLEVLSSADQLRPETRNLLSKTGLIAFRLLPEKPRDEDPSDIMGFHTNTLAAGSRQGYIRYWPFSDETWEQIKDTIENFGGQPAIYTVKGLCVDQCKITDGFRPEHQPTQWQFELSNPGDWAQDFQNTRVTTRPGGKWEWWITSQR